MIAFSRQGYRHWVHDLSQRHSMSRQAVTMPIAASETGHKKDLRKYRLLLSPLSRRHLSSDMTHCRTKSHLDTPRYQSLGLLLSRTRPSSCSSAYNYQNHNKMRNCRNLHAAALVSVTVIGSGPGPEFSRCSASARRQQDNRQAQRRKAHCRETDQSFQHIDHDVLSVDRCRDRPKSARRK